MKKLNLFAVVFMVILILSSVVSAKPFLVCEEPPDVPEFYILILNNGAEIETPYPLHYDLAELDPGLYVAQAKASYPLWGVSELSVPLEFTKPLLTAPNLFIQPQ